jgi:hypothetical protein
MSQPSSTPGVYNPTITTTGPGSQAQQAFATQQANATRQNTVNLMGKGGSKYRGGAIALAPMQPGTSPSQVALNAQVQSTGAQTATNGQYDNTVNKTITGPKTGGRRISRTRKTRTNKRKTRRNYKKSKRRTKGSRK